MEVFKGNTAAPATAAAPVARLKERFGIERLAWVGDRGMLTSARIKQVLKPQGITTVGIVGMRAAVAALRSTSRSGLCGLGPVAQVMETRLHWAFATIAAHLLGSIAMTLLGIGTVRLFRTIQF